MTRIMTNLAKITLGGAIAISPAVIYGQTAGGTSGGAGTTGNAPYTQSGNAGTAGETGNSMNGGAATAPNAGANTAPGTETNGGTATAPGNEVNGGNATAPETGTSGANTGETGTGSNAGTGFGSTSSSQYNAQSNRRMPRTSSGWLDLLLGGSLLSAAGVAMRRLRKA
jgi:hypothetical protein